MLINSELGWTNSLPADPEEVFVEKKSLFHAPRYDIKKTLNCCIIRRESMKSNNHLFMSVK